MRKKLPVAKHHTDGVQSLAHVIRCDDNRVVVSYVNLNSGGKITAEVKDSGNGFIVCFPGLNFTQQDHYVCMDYAQARDLVIGLAEFKEELGFSKD